MATTLVSVEEYLHTSYADGDCEYVDGEIVERNVGEIDHGDLQSRIYLHLATHYPKFWSAVEVRTQVKSTRFRVPDVVLVAGPRPAGKIIKDPPHLVVEVLSPDDRAAMQGEDRRLPGLRYSLRLGGKSQDAARVRTHG
jgi:Uma2 family endonuclease